MKIALIISTKQEKLAEGVSNDEDTELFDFLLTKGLDIVPVVWNDDKVDWSGYDVALVKSPWDYHHYIDDFLAWLDRLARLGVEVLNPINIIKWNSDKRYLIECAEKGLPVIPSRYLAQGSMFDDGLFDVFASDRLVIKPAISAGADNTLVIDRSNTKEHIGEIEQLLGRRGCLVQPFVKEVQGGEWSLLFFNGKYSHSVLKIPRSGDFRVQHHYGGCVSYTVPDTSLIEQAEAYLTDLPQPVLYARVDGIVINNVLQLMELELIEPYLFFNKDDTLMENYYHALMDLVS